MIDYSDCNLEKVSVHQVGNITREETLFLSKSELAIPNEKLLALVKQFFLSPFTHPEFYSFSFSNEDFKLNPLYSFASQVFDSKNLFHPTSVNIAKLLYEISVHPQIKSGDLFVGYFTDIEVDGKLVNALGIFKSENRQPFLKLDATSSDFNLQYEDGINVEKLDKGCLIFNDEKESGYKLCIIDKSNKSEAHYWKELFLMAKPRNDGYHHTKQFLELTKNYITGQFTDDFEVTKTDQIDVLNRSLDYFKKKDNFDRNNFEKEVLQQPEIIESFKKFDTNYRTVHDITMEDDFGISTFAVKKQARIFKSVLKLDKNFHIYIHGDKELIERGTDADGRKYYKIYYREEF
ncbi:MAG: nucleoid-associated protein [Cyclobacteriaceae bacterium]|nr:nucleoid-associated protein [Cyclobacteriaceae bacterium]